MPRWRSCHQPLIVAASLSTHYQLLSVVDLPFGSPSPKIWYHLLIVAASLDPWPILSVVDHPCASGSLKLVQQLIVLNHPCVAASVKLGGQSPCPRVVGSVRSRWWSLPFLVPQYTNFVAVDCGQLIGYSFASQRTVCWWTYELMNLLLLLFLCMYERFIAVFVIDVCHFDRDNGRRIQVLDFL